MFAVMFMPMFYLDTIFFLLFTIIRGNKYKKNEKVILRKRVILK